MKEVLITGASGFIGSNVLNYLLKRTDYTYTCICSWEHRGTPKNLHHLVAHPRVRIFTHDLKATIPEMGDFDYIINMASLSHVDTSIADPVNFIYNNVALTLNILEYARKHKPEIFIQFSTDEVFGANEHKEWDTLLPANPYAASKAAQEMIALSYWRTYDIPVVITNSNNIVGPDQDPEKFVPKLIKLISNDQEVTIHVSNGKPGKRYYNPVENVADALLFILDTTPTKFGDLEEFSLMPDNTIEPGFANKPDRYNIPGGEELDNLQMAQLVAKLLNKELKYKLVDVESIRPGYDTFYPHTEGKLTRLGWRPPYKLEEKMAEWI